MSRRDSTTRLSDAELVAAIRREEPAAIAELYRRFAPVLRRSATGWLGAGAERDELVDEVIADVALALMRPTTATPRSLAAYLLVALRHRAAAVKLESRLDGGRLCDVDLLAHELPSPPPGAEPAPLHPVLGRLAERLDAELTGQERLLLAWGAEHVPMRTVAAWLSIGYDAALKRASRLRARLRARTLEHAATLPPEERRVLDAFLGRAEHGRATAPPSTERSETGS